MKQSKILKVVSYIAIPILVMSLILSIFSIVMKENNYYNKEQYFSSDEFVSSYIGYLSRQTYNLIHDKNTFYNTQDGDIKIQYTSDEKNYYDDLKNRYFLIIYKNKALTNVGVTEQTTSIEGIKEYINKNQDSKKVNIINGNIEADSNAIQDKGIRYLSELDEIYYTIKDIDETDNSTQKQKIEYITAKADDFQIYSSYEEEFYEYSEISIMNNILDNISIFNEYCYFIIPLSTILIILILMYLIISIGYKKGEDGIVLNDFDKIPLEIIVDRKSVV